MLVHLPFLYYYTLISIQHYFRGEYLRHFRRSCKSRHDVRAKQTHACYHDYNYFNAVRDRRGKTARRA